MFKKNIYSDIWMKLEFSYKKCYFPLDLFVSAFLPSLVCWFVFNKFPDLIFVFMEFNCRVRVCNIVIFLNI